LPRSAEIRPQNETFNATRGSAPHPAYPRVTGNFTGTTDEILQWVACKWGIDEDIVRAQIARESWWKHDSRGDLTSDQTHCHPSLRTASGPCPESYGLGQVRYWYHREAMDDAIVSSAYNVDYVYALWRDCFEGRVTWLNTVERGRDYAAGDVWGCLGVWFSGRWYTQPAVDYMGWVRGYLDARIWTTPDFVNFRG
jgi:autotransporter family porin